MIVSVVLSRYLCFLYFVFEFAMTNFNILILRVFHIGATDLLNLSGFSESTRGPTKLKKKSVSEGADYN